MKKLLSNGTFWFFMILVLLFLWWKYGNTSFTLFLHDSGKFIGVVVDSTKGSRDKLKELKNDIKELKK